MNNDSSKALYNKLSCLISKNRCNNCFSHYSGKNSIYTINLRDRVIFTSPINNSFIVKKYNSATINQGRATSEQKIIFICLWCANCNETLELEMPYN